MNVEKTLGYPWPLLADFVTEVSWDGRRTVIPLR
jgi:hypothetical protein